MPAPRRESKPAKQMRIVNGFDRNSVLSESLNGRPSERQPSQSSQKKTRSPKKVAKLYISSKGKHSKAPSRQDEPTDRLHSSILFPDANVNVSVTNHGAGSQGTIMYDSMELLKQGEKVNGNKNKHKLMLQTIQPVESTLDPSKGQVTTKTVLLSNEQPDFTIPNDLSQNNGSDGKRTNLGMLRPSDISLVGGTVVMDTSQMIEEEELVGEMKQMDCNPHF